jgi:hypothetical protein
VDQLQVDSGGSIVVDGTAGPVDLYVQDRFLLASGSTVVNVRESAIDFRIQMSGVDPADTAVDRFRFETNSPFTGQIYAPESNVALPDFCVFKGAIASKTLVIGNRSELEHDPLLTLYGLAHVGYHSMNWRLLAVPESIANPVEYDPQAYYSSLGQEPPLIGDSEIPIEEIVRFISPETAEIMTLRGDRSKLKSSKLGTVLDVIPSTEALFAKIKRPPGRVDDNIDDDKPRKR